MEKLIQDNKVAVLYSPGFGAGWYTWNNVDCGAEIMFDPVLAQYVLQAKYDEALTYASMRWPDAYLGGINDLQVEWIPIGTDFRIHEYDGAETIELKDEMDWVTA